MRLRSLQAVAGQFDDARLDDDPTLPIGGIAVTRREDAPDTGTATDAVAVKDAAAWGCANAPTAAGERHRMQHLLQIPPAAFAAARADLSELRFELVIPGHSGASEPVQTPVTRNMATETPPENRRHLTSAKSETWWRVAPPGNPWRQGGSRKQTCRQTLRRHLPEMAPLFHLAFPAFRSDWPPPARSPTLSDTGLVNHRAETSLAGARNQRLAAWEAGSVEPAFQHPARCSARRFEGRFSNRHTIEMAIEPDHFGC